MRLKKFTIKFLGGHGREQNVVRAAENLVWRKIKASYGANSETSMSDKA